MRFASASGILVIGVLLVLSAPDKTAAHDLYTPLSGLVERLCDIEPLKLGPLISGFYKAIQCLTPAPTSSAKRSIETLLENVEAKLDITCFGEIDLPFPEKEFREIHNFLWKNDTQFHDLVKFLYENGFQGSAERDIYEIIKVFYGMIGAPDDTKLDIKPWVPDTPTVTPKKSTNSKKSIQPSGFQLLSTMFQERATCTEQQWIDIFNEILDSQGLQWFDLITFIIKAVQTPDVQALFDKINEEGKGDEFRQLLYLRGVIILVHEWDAGIKADKFYQALINTLERILELTGSDIKLKGHDINIVRNLIHIAEFLIWDNPFPNPPITYKAIPSY